MKLQLSEPGSLASAWSWESLRQSRLFHIYLTMLGLYVVSGLVQRNFFSYGHVMDLLVISSFLGILAMGQTLVVLTGGLDLSLAYALNLGAVIMTQVATQHGGGVALALTIASGLVIGALNGLGVAYLNISPIIMTMAMNSILQSVSFVYTNGTPMGTAPPWLRALGTGSVLGIRTAVWVWVLLSVGMALLLSRTTFGRKIYAIGTNPSVAYLSGVRNRRVLVAVYTLSGLFAVIAGTMAVGYYGQSFLGMGDSLVLPSLAAVVIGGTSIMGGRGGYSGTAAAVVIIYVLLSILTVLNINTAGQQIIYGLVLLAVLFLNGRSASAT
ncbi:MAG: ABC transporter permease [Alicyclobacillus sp.]|nr:ABC transporter permease [Alicyclobacillus sp.]